MSASIGSSTLMDKTTESAAIQLTDDEIEGIGILEGLQTVMRGVSVCDASDIIAINVVRNEQTQVAFVDYIRRAVGFEAPAQRAEVKRLLDLRGSVT
jgi:hypothetical protein